MRCTKTLVVLAAIWAVSGLGLESGPGQGRWWLGSRARAEELNPAIYVLVDTSGSMLMNPDGTLNAYGDGSAEHPHAAGVTSRLYMAKGALTTVINAYGEVWWGLARFQQYSGHNYLCMCHDEMPNNLSGCGGYGGLWAPEDECRLCDVMQPYPDYDLEGTHDRVCINYAGGLFDNCTDPITGDPLTGADILVPVGDGTADDILKWIDNSESDPGEAGYNASLPPEQQPDPELRAVGGTPIGGSLQDLYDQLSNTDIGNDPLRGCRPYVVIVLTDGAESCDTDPVAAATQLRQTPDLQHDCSGGCPTNSSCVGGHCVYDVQTYVVAFAVAPNELANNHAIAQAGGTGAAIQASNESDLVSAMAEIIAGSIRTEMCNGVDDDCDSLVDEDFPELGAGCDNGQLGQCHCTGTVQCRADGSGTECDYAASSASNPCGDSNFGYGPENSFGCDGLDNDCDGFTDEGLNCGPPPPELCNNIDDDNDPTTPDGQDDPAVGQVCGTSVGVCEPGVTACVGGSIVCQGGVQASVEVCDGLDNDCDGVVDGLSQPCYSGGSGNGCTWNSNTASWDCLGQCSAGISVCEALSEPDPTNTWGPCLGEVLPAEELCDGVDNDCDGQTDEDLTEECYPPGSGQETGCIYDAQTSQWTCLGECHVGTRDCQNAVWGSCQNVVSPALEVCDNLDNDCDGETDEEEDIPGLGQPCGTAIGRCTPGVLLCIDGNEVCQGGEGPFEGVCNGEDDDCDGLIDEDDEVADEVNLPCGNDVGVCEPGVTQCLGGEIVCTGGTQPGDEVCNGLDDDCDGSIDDDAYCPPESWCYMGECRVACGSGEFPCPSPLVCRTIGLDDGDRDLCVPAGVECGDKLCEPGWVCEDGECVDPCDPNPCEWWQECVQGSCVDASCSSGVESCPSGQFCHEHECIDDPCAETECDPIDESCRRSCDDSGCTASCEPVCTCGVGEICDDQGQCVPDPCVDVSCEEGKICVQGECVTDPCALVTCDAGQVCYDGDCVADPCDSALCPEHTHCVVQGSSSGQPQGWCYPDEGTWISGTEAEKVTVAGTGGFGCNSAGGGSGPLGFMLGLFAMIGLWWKSRRRLWSRARSVELMLGFFLVAASSGCGRGTYEFSSEGHWNLPDGSLAGDGSGTWDVIQQPDACVPVEETCNGKDDDCDGLTDEDFNLDEDPQHCGSCDNACHYDNAFALCEQGHCVMGACLPGYWDVDGDDSTGCEYGCLVTNDGEESCDGNDNDCDGETDEDFDLDNDPNNCGQCHRVCAFFQGTGACEGGNCVLDHCNPPYVDRDGNPDTGCECLATASDDSTCDGVDDDCDNEVDEDFQSSSCYTEAVGCSDDGNGGFDCVGACHAGQWECQQGHQVCAQQQGPVGEVCNGVDDDCDGITDNGFDVNTDPANCGSCGHSCFTSGPANTYSTGCVGGQCQYACLPGFHDVNGDLAQGTNGNGCEYTCEKNAPTGVEFCDGQDNDCDGQTDEAGDLAAPPSGLCKEQADTPCVNVSVTCTTGILGTTWYCQYPAGVETDSANPNLVLTNETLCDGFDGNCDGNIDESFTPAVGTACDDGNLGVCRGTGTYQCNSQHTGTECVITHPGATPQNEICDAIDNDCDGLVDESFANPGTNPSYVVDDLVEITVGGHSVWAYRYEASRPTADGSSEGSGTDVRACSRVGVKPWSRVTYEQARQACQKAGMTLCDADSWYEACNGQGVTWKYPYSSSTYNGSACNGADAGNGVSVATGSMPNCDSNGYGAEDLSGNLREWTSEVIGYTDDGRAIYTVRGGAFTDQAGGLACDFTSTALVEDAAASNVGFRCCTRCGNGVLDPGEQCDDGNLTNGDGCSAVCGPDTCGDGVVQAGEDCDCGTNPNQLPAGCLAVNGAPEANCSINCQIPEERCSSLYPEDQDRGGEANDCADPACSGTWCSDVSDDDGDGFSEVDGDCNDGDPNISPAADEVCGNNIDDNCNGFTDDAEPDKDGDGHLRCVGGATHDCDDWEDDAYPGHPEICDDGIDNDCDGNVDADGPCATACEIAEFEKSYIGCDYWAASTMNSLLSGTFSSDFGVVVNNANGEAANITISKAGVLLVSDTVNANSQRVFLLNFDDQLRTTTDDDIIVAGGAYHVTSDLPVTVYEFNPFDFQYSGEYSYSNDAALILPSHVYSNHYMVVTKATYWNTSPGWFAVISQADNTQVRITFAANVWNGPDMGQTHTYTLQEGDVLQVPSRDCNAGSYAYCSDDYDLTGTIIEVTQGSPVAVFAGHNCLYIPATDCCCDHVEEQMLPLEAWGTQFVAAPTDYPQETDDRNMYRVVSAVDNNTVTFYPNSVHAPVVLDAGEYLEVTTSERFSVECDDACTVVQYTLADNVISGVSDPAMGLLVPMEQFRSDYSFLVPSSMTYNYVNIFKPVGVNAPTVYLDGNPIPESSFTPAIGNTYFGVARINISDSPYSHTITSSQPFGIMVYGFASYTSYLYPGGLDLKAINAVN